MCVCVCVCVCVCDIKSLNHTDSTKALSPSLPLSSTTLRRSSQLHLVSAQGWRKSFLIDQYFCVHRITSFIRLSLTQQCPIGLVHLEWFVRWMVSGRTATVLGVLLPAYVKKHVAFFCSSHLAFAPSILLELRWCYYTVVPARQQLGSNRVLFYQSDLVSIWSTTCKYIYICVCVYVCVCVCVCVCVEKFSVRLVREWYWATNVHAIPSIHCTIHHN